jgi:hypothetical protein
MTINGTPTKTIATKVISSETEDSEPDLATVVTEPETSEPNAVASSAESGKDAPDAESSLGRRSVSVSVRGLVTGAMIVALIAAVAVCGWLYLDTRSQLDAQATQLANDAHAEKIALDYAVSAATMDFKDLQAWHVRLVAGTSPELNKKLSDAGTSMEQVLVPLEWSSTAQPLVAKVRSSTGGIYVVDSFVSVQTKTVQAPKALQSTATYSTTIDSNNNWQITDVGGIGSAMEPK